MKKGSAAAHGHARKHTHAHKHVHGKHPKHHPKNAKKAHHHHHKAKAAHTVGHHQAHAKGLAAAPGDVACCTAEALAASLRLAGVSVTDADVLGLHRLAGADDERGMPVVRALEAASAFGLAGVRLDAFDLVGDLEERCGGIACFLCAGIVRADLLAEQPDHRPVHGRGAGELAEGGRVDGHLVAAQGHGDAFLGHGGSLVLGLDLPGPHAVLATPEGWWSWGELWCPCEFPDAVIDEVWEVAWLLSLPGPATPTATT